MINNSYDSFSNSTDKIETNVPTVKQACEKLIQQNQPFFYQCFQILNSTPDKVLDVAIQTIRESANRDALSSALAWLRLGVSCEEELRILESVLDCGSLPSWSPSVSQASEYLVSVAQTPVGPQAIRLMHLVAVLPDWVLDHILLLKLLKLDFTKYYNLANDNETDSSKTDDKDVSIKNNTNNTDSSLNSLIKTNTNMSFMTHFPPLIPSQSELKTIELCLRNETLGKYT